MALTVPVSLEVAGAVATASPEHSAHISGATATDDPGQVPSDHPVATRPDARDSSTRDRGDLEPATDEDVAVAAGRTLSTPLSECPEVLEFFARPEIAGFMETHRGGVPAPEAHWAGTDCPGIGELEARYEKARAAVQDSRRS